jgi:hypothetical protein
MKRNLLLAALSCMLMLFVACEKDEIKDVSLTYDVNLPLDITYARVYQAIDSAAIADAFNISYVDFMEKLGVNDTSVVHYYALNPDGTINETKPTASGFGHWFDADGKTATWAKNAVLFSEFTDHFGFEIGQYPNATAVGDKYTIKQGFVYQNATASITFNITITAAAE